MRLISLISLKVLAKYFKVSENKMGRVVDGGV